MAQLKNSKVLFNGCNLKDMYGVEPCVVSKNTDTIFGVERSVSVEEGVNNETTSYSLNNSRPSISVEFIKRGPGLNILPINDSELNELARVLFIKDIGVLQDGDKLYYGWFTNGTSLRNSANQGYVSLTFELASPYAYSMVNTYSYKITGSKIFDLDNISTVDKRLYFDVELIKSGKGNVEIINKLNGNTVKLINIEDGENIIIDGDSREVYSKTNPKKNIFSALEYNKDFPYLEYGINTITVKGDCEIQITYQCPMLII